MDFCKISLQAQVDVRGTLMVLIRERQIYKISLPIHKKDLDKNEEGVGFCGSLEHIWDYVYCRSNIFPCLTLCNCDLWVS